jgi:hypothetical protein
MVRLNTRERFFGALYGKIKHKRKIFLGIKMCTLNANELLFVFCFVDKTNYLHHTHPTKSKQENIAFPLSMDIITHQIINISTAQCRNVSLNAIHKTKAKQNKNNNAFAFSVHIFIPLIINMFEEQHGYYSLNLPTKNS